MSAAAVRHTAPTVDRPTRPDLRLVPTGAALEATRPALRISRFGRVLCTLGILLVVVALGATLLGAGSANASIDHTVRVHAGQTLSQLAVRELPQVTVAEGVAQIQLANGLSTSQVHAGQELRIPAIGRR